MPLLDSSKGKGTPEPTLKVCVGGTLYIVNPSDKDGGDVSIEHGSLIVGYGKGKWVSGSAGDEKEIKYVLDNAQEQVIFNSSLTTLGELVNAKRLNSKGESCRICHHELVENPADEGARSFNLKANQQIFSCRVTSR